MCVRLRCPALNSSSCSSARTIWIYIEIDLDMALIQGHSSSASGHRGLDGGDLAATVLEGIRERERGII